MTREEAVARIKDHIEIHRYHERNAVKILEALDMAIKALEQPEPCGDTISRQAAINAIRASTSKYTGFMEMEMYTDDDAVEAVEGLPPTQPEQRWIPCNERLPFAEYGESDTVLATCRNRQQESPDEYRWIRMLYFNGGNWCYPTGETYEEKVLAWMPLPEPYRGEGEQDADVNT